MSFETEFHNYNEFSDSSKQDTKWLRDNYRYSSIRTINGRPTDDAGHIVAQVLGGTGQENYNIFPQNLTINRGAWRVEEAAIRQLAETIGQPVEMIVQLFYSSPTETRPTHLMYRAAYNNTCHSANVLNP